MPTRAEENRDRILARLDAILGDGYMAPEVKRSRLYAALLDEMDLHGAWVNEQLVAWLGACGVPTVAEAVRRGEFERFLAGGGR